MYQLTLHVLIFHTLVLLSQRNYIDISKITAYIYTGYIYSINEYIVMIPARNHGGKWGLVPTTNFIFLKPTCYLLIERE